MLESIFREAYEVESACDGQSAINILEDHHEKISAVILDIMMPIMDGKEVLSIMKEKEWTKTIPVLIVTSDVSNETEKECLNMGAHDFLRKPFNAALVKARVENAISLYSYKNGLEKLLKGRLKNSTDRMPCLNSMQ